MSGPKEGNLAIRHLGQTEEGKQQHRGETAQGVLIYLNVLRFRKCLSKRPALPFASLSIFVLTDLHP